MKKKTRDQRRNDIVLDYLNTKFKPYTLETRISPRNPNYIMYYLGTTMILSAWKYTEKSNFRANFGGRFLEEFATWFPKFKYKRRILRDWLLTNHNPQLPEGTVLYVP